MKDLLRIADLEQGELFAVLERALEFKASPAAFAGAASGRVVGLLFEKPSLRTRFSVEAALARIGAHPIGAYDREVGLGSREPIPDAGKVLSAYTDAIVMRTFRQNRLEALAAAADVPVVNALSDSHHPMQALADVMTLVELHAAGDVRGLKGARVAYVGDGNNTAHSLIEAAALAGFTIACACPAGFEPRAEVVGWSRDRGGVVELTTDPRAAVDGAIAVYTDVWVSMGQETEFDARRESFEPFRVTAELMARAANGAVFLHCLPAHRGEEVTGEVIDGPRSRVFEQAENRMHTAAGVFLTMW